MENKKLFNGKLMRKMLKNSSKLQEVKINNDVKIVKEDSDSDNIEDVFKGIDVVKLTKKKNKSKVVDVPMSPKPRIGIACQLDKSVRPRGSFLNNANNVCQRLTEKTNDKIGRPVSRDHRKFVFYPKRKRSETVSEEEQILPKRHRSASIVFDKINEKP